MMYDVAVIGAGIIGTFIARELSRYKINVVIIEKENDVANGATMANSGIIYEAYHSKPEKVKGSLIPRGNELYDQICEELDVPFKRVGSLVIGFDEEDMQVVKKMYEKAVKTNVPGIRIVNKEEVLQMEPNLNPDINFALYSPTCGIISPFEMAVALAENAVDNGAELLLNSEVTDIKKINGIFKITMNQKHIETKYVINCAGIYADKINNMLAVESKLKIFPKRGQYLVLDKTVGNLVNNVILQCKTEKEKGVLLIPTVHNNLMIGPGLEDIEEDDKQALETTSEMIHQIKNKAVKTCDIPFNQVVRSFSGLKAKVEGGDFIIEESQEVQGLINAAGIHSPGLTCAPAVAESVIKIVKGIFERNGEAFIEKEDFNPTRKKVIRFKELTDIEKTEVIKENAQYGRIICRCGSVTEGEIVDAIHRNAGAITVKGVKKRTAATMGKCQGGFCGPRIVEILARELKKEMHEIVYDSEQAYILT